MAQPLVSVLVPVYNGETYLDEALASIQAQTYRGLEVLIKDDGSSDASLEIARKYVEIDSRFRLIDDAPSGSAQANHIALAKLAKGRFIKFCHQDDVLERGCIAALVKPMAANPRISMATSVRRFVDDTGAELDSGSFTATLTDSSAALDGKDVIRNAFHTNLNRIGEPTAGLYRNRLVDPDRMLTFGDFPLTMLFDLALWFNLLLRGNLYFHAETLSSHRVHGGQLSQRDEALLNVDFEWLGMLRHAIQLKLFLPGPSLTMAGTSLQYQLASWRYDMLPNLFPARFEEYAPRFEDAMEQVTQLTGAPPVRPEAG